MFLTVSNVVLDVELFYYVKISFCVCIYRLSNVYVQMDIYLCNMYYWYSNNLVMYYWYGNNLVMVNYNVWLTTI